MKPVLTCIAALLLSTSASLAATYTLDFTGSGVIDDSYGDNGEADISYRAIAAGVYGNQATLGTLSFWGTGYGDLDGAAWGNPDPSIGEIRIETANATDVITLNGFDLGGWASDELAEWRIYDLAWNLIVSGSGIAPDASNHLSVGSSGPIIGGLILQWGADAWDVGIENVSYSVNVSQVPVPASLPLLLIGFGAISVLRRRKST